MNVYEKLLAVQAELKAPKGQYNSFGKYKYRSCEDILEAVKPLLKKHKATLCVGDEIVLTGGDRYYIKATAIFVDIESGERIENTAYAREDESKKGMDGSQITGTASSYARKYCLNGLFLIDDTKDADTDAYKLLQDNAGKKVEGKVTSVHNDGNVRYLDDIQCQVKSSNGNWYNVEELPKSSIESLLKNPAFSAAHAAMQVVLDGK